MEAASGSSSGRIARRSSRAAARAAKRQNRQVASYSRTGRCLIGARRRTTARWPPDRAVCAIIRRAALEDFRRTRSRRRGRLRVDPRDFEAALGESQSELALPASDLEHSRGEDQVRESRRARGIIECVGSSEARHRLPRSPRASPALEGRSSSARSRLPGRAPSGARELGGGGRLRGSRRPSLGAASSGLRHPRPRPREARRWESARRPRPSSPGCGAGVYPSRRPGSKAPPTTRRSDTRRRSRV